MRSGEGAVRCRPLQASRGFTLIEMLVVMAIVALLLTLAVPRYFGSLAKAREAVLRENLQVMRTVIDRFHADKGRYPQSLNELVEQRYLREVPLDPLTESRSSWIQVPPVSDDGKGLADVKSGAAGSGQDTVPYAEY